MNRDITVSLVQPDIIWEKIANNLEVYSQLLEKTEDRADLIVFPEMFTTGFSNNTRQLAEYPGERTMQWMRKWSGRLGSVITGSIILKDQDKFYNRLIWMRPDGSFLWYDKRHLFRMSEEHLSYAAGKSKLITELMGWRICTLICYDLRFPVWSKNRFIDFKWDYDILIYIANWPAERNNIWSTLLQARAIENQAYVIGVNRVGKDGNNITYSGNSMVIDPNGKILSSCKEGLTEMKSVRLSGKDLNKNRNKLEAGKEWDQFNIIV